MVMSLTNSAWSQTGVADAAGACVDAGCEGRDNAVFVATEMGRVGVLNDADGVNCAWTVRAAAVNTALACSVGVVGALEGKLHADRMKIKAVRMERMRASLNMGFSSLKHINFTPRTPHKMLPFLRNHARYTSTDGGIFCFVPGQLEIGVEHPPIKEALSVRRGTEDHMRDVLLFVRLSIPSRRMARTCMRSLRTHTQVELSFS
jgi:hypothetical protein